MKAINLVNTIQQHLEEIVDHYTWVAETVREFDKDYIVDTDVPTVTDIFDLSFQITDRSIDLIHDEVSFGEDFSRVWSLSFDLLELQTREEIVAYVDKMVGLDRLRKAKAKEQEVEMLRKRLKMLEGNDVGL